MVCHWDQVEQFMGYPLYEMVKSWAVRYRVWLAWLQKLSAQIGLADGPADVVGDRGQAGCQAGMACLNECILYEAETILHRIVYRELRLWQQLNVFRLQDRLELDELALVATGEYDFAHTIWLLY